MYHPSAAPQVVQSQEEMDALSPEWVESPADVKPAPARAGYDPADSAEAGQLRSPETGDENEIEELGLDEPGTRKKKRR